MSIVVSDASCLILFTNIDRLDLLRSLFGEIWITSAVEQEYQLDLPNFVFVRDPADLGRLDVLRLILDPWEASAIALAVENPGCKIIIDEKKGRRIAISIGLDVTGSVGIIAEATKQGLIDADEPLIQILDRQNFRLSARLKELLLGKD